MDNRVIKLNPKERRKLAISEIVIIALAIVGLGVVAWLAWFRPSVTQHTINSYQACVEAGNPVQDSYPSVCTTKDGVRFTNPDQLPQGAQTPPPAGQVTDQAPAPPVDGEYLTITEWQVHAPLPAEYNDLKYTYVQTDLGERTSFTFKRLEDIGICKNDLGVSMTRSTTKNEAPFNIDNPEPIAQAGDYYYYLAYGGSPCYDPENTGHMKVVDTINGGKLTDAVKQTLKKLQPAT